MRAPAKILLFEDSATDAELLVRELRSSGIDFEARIVDELAALAEAIAAGADILLADCNVYGATIEDTLATVAASGRDVPVIAVSGVIDEEAAVSALRSGARDFVTKQNFARLPSAVERELAEAASRRGRAEAERELETKDEQLRMQEAQRLEALGLLAGGIAHDFNNLLVGVLGNAQLARRDVRPGSPVEQRIDAIEAAARRAADLTRQMLAYAGKETFRLERLALRDVVEEIAALLATSVPPTTEIRYDFPPGPLYVEGDPTGLRQVVMNLLTNASEALDGRPGVVTISGSTRHVLAPLPLPAAPEDALEPGRYACLTVVDTGSGMPPEVAARIFDPFFTTKFTGRGLGLAAVHGIVRAHHGAIEVQSEPGVGTTVSVLLPQAEAPAHVEVEDVAPSDGWRKGGRVLVADDNEPLRMLAREILQDAGFDVVEARDGAEAEQLMAALGGELRLALIDLTMPERDGLSIANAARERYPDLPVVLMSGYSEHEIEHVNGCGFLPKPFGPDDLLDRVRNALRGS